MSQWCLDETLNSLSDWPTQPNHWTAHTDTLTYAHIQTNSDSDMISHFKSIWVYLSECVCVCMQGISQTAQVSQTKRTEYFVMIKNIMLK